MALIKSSNENTEILKNILKENENEPMINDLVTEVLGLRSKSIKYKTIKKFDTISEYEFNMVKATCDLEMENEIDLYFKFVKKDKIKESVFCYWCLLYEEALEKNNEKISMATIINKVMITEVGMERYKNSVFLEMKENETDILKHGTEVHFIDFEKYIENHKNNSNSLEDWNKYIDKESEDILMIGVVLNEEIGRSNIKII